jgi:peroxiredoxin
MNSIKSCLLTFLFLQTLITSSVLGHEDSFAKMGVVLPKNEKIAPNFILETVTGEKISLKDFKGKAVLLNFWATWCQPCKKELPSMQRIYEELNSEGVEVVAISIDRNKKEQVEKYIQNYNLTFPVLLDPSQKVRKDYFILGLPTSYLIGSDGKLKGFISGAREWDSNDSKEMFSTLMHLQ